MKRTNTARVMNYPTPILFPPPSEKIAHTIPIIIVTVVKSCDLLDNEATVDGPDNIIDNKSRLDNIFHKPPYSPSFNQVYSPDKKLLLK